MHKLVVAVFDTTLQAGKVRKKYLKKNTKFRDNFNKSIIIIRNIDGTIELHYVHRFAAEGAALGGVWGGIIGILFLNPVIGALAGASLGAVIGNLGDLGVEKHFMADLSKHLKPSSSAVFIPGKKDELEGICDLLKEEGGEVVSTMMQLDDKKKILEKIDALYEGTLKNT